MKHFRSITLLLFLSGFFLSLSCSHSQSLEVQSTVPAQVVLVDHLTPEQERKKLGTTPQAIDIDSFKDKLIVVQGLGKVPYYILPIATDAENIKLKVKLQSVSDFGESELPLYKQSDLNFIIRTVLEAYQKTLDYADQNVIFKQLDRIKSSKELAIPHIIKGMVYLRDAKRDLALQEFERAKQLDDQDPNIENLIRAARNER